MAIAETGVNSDRSIEQIPLGQVPTDLQPGSLPKKMRAWVIRRDREGEPRRAFQQEDIEVPEPGAD
ncbi:MAG TPA: crotonyl-CoA carboxylase/reductase, partial [Candidatus Dormibacteraeota bacterium]|nr:crotonyl-CoA carboxylase/reductase [Candidatus Dormibacteraeota bacterium]